MLDMNTLKPIFKKAVTTIAVASLATCCAEPYKQPKKNEMSIVYSQNSIKKSSKKDDNNNSNFKKQSICSISIQKEITNVKKSSEISSINDFNSCYNEHSIMYGGDTMSIELSNNIDTINSFAELEEGWNGYNAMTIDKTVIDAAIEIVKKLNIQPEVFPTGRNSIQIEYEKENGDYLEFEIYSKEAINMLNMDGNDEVISKRSIKICDISKVVNEFYGIR